jgi:hypothetical protein
MTPFAFFAFLGVPLIVLGLGWAAVLLQERVSRHHRAAANRQGTLPLPI